MSIAVILSAGGLAIHSPHATVLRMSKNVSQLMLFMTFFYYLLLYFFMGKKGSILELFDNFTNNSNKNWFVKKKNSTFAVKKS